MKNALFLTLVLYILASCSTISYVNIETYKPAEITFPNKVSRVLIVNNATPQPDRVGYEFKYLGTVQDTARAKADSALYDACKSLGVSILETGYFSDVLLLHEATRTDDNHLVDEKLSPQLVEELCFENNVDAIISIDRLLFDMTKNVSSFGGLYVGVINVQIAGVMRAYVPQRETPLATVLVNDSVFWTETAESMVFLNAILPSPEYALQEAGKYIGTLASPNFVPHWDNEVRWFYVGGTTEWKQASAYASTQRWDAAEQIWHSIFNKTGNQKNKAKAASNIAFSQEMLGHYNEALEWAEKALSIFEKEGKESQNYQLLHHYTVALQERIRDSRKLNIQIGEI